VIPAVLTVFACAAWCYLALGRGAFWLGRENDRAMHEALALVPDGFAWPSVAVVIPARNEASFVASTVGSLFAQNYPGSLSVVVVDDHSHDDTRAVAMSAGQAAACPDRLTVIAAPRLPPGWTGKLWAMAHGVDFANNARPPPDFLLLTDADVRYDSNSVAALVSDAVKHQHVLSSLMVQLHCRSLAERICIPAFVFFFQMLYPFAWVNDPRHRTAAAAGGCMLVRRASLAEAGGIGAIQSELIDDVSLGRKLKRVGPIHLALGEAVHSLRPCLSIAAIRHMVVRTAYTQLNRSVLLLGLVVVLMLGVFVAPVVVGMTTDGWIRWLALSTWLVMALLFGPIATRYRVSRLWGIVLPGIALIYLCFTIDSAVQYWLGRGGVWKGRSQGHAGSASEAPGP
jgi:hopene-associated glycosyltransferase HpnB